MLLAHTRGIAHRVRASTHLCNPSFANNHSKLGSKVTLISLLRILFIGRIGSTKLVLPKWQNIDILNRDNRVGHQYPNCLDLNKHFQFVFFHDFKNAPVEFLVSNCGSKRDKLATFGASHVHYFERCARNLLMVKGRK
jgi:hypothetical protein